MEKFNELLAKVKELEITQAQGDWEENIPNDIWEEYFKDNYKEVKHNLAVDTHRWYETSIVVIEIFGKFLGIRYITNMFSEEQSYEDCFVKLEFYEMKEVQTVTYEKV